MKNFILNIKRIIGPMYALYYPLLELYIWYIPAIFETFKINF